MIRLAFWFIVFGIATGMVVATAGIVIGDTPVEQLIVAGGIFLAAAAAVWCAAQDHG